MINSIFCESDRYLIKETISLLSQLLSKDWQWKENRSEWKLLQTFSRMSLINKFSLNENSLSLPSLIRTLATSVRKVLYYIYLYIYRYKKIYNIFFYF